MPRTPSPISFLQITLGLSTLREKTVTLLQKADELGHGMDPGDAAELRGNIIDFARATRELANTTERLAAKYGKQGDG